MVRHDVGCRGAAHGVGDARSRFRHATPAVAAPGTGGGSGTDDRARRSRAVPGRLDAGAQRTERSGDAWTLSVRTEKDKPAADLASEAMPKQSIADFSMADKSLVMGYSFTWEGNPVSAVII